MRIGRHAVASSTGRRRFQNEDAYVVAPPLFAVADGMGGAQAGEVASRLAATALTERAHGTHGEPVLTTLVREANTRIFERSQLDPSEAGMGTTVTAAIVDEELGTVSFGHVGDSRAYRYREGQLQQVTSDHSLVAELVRSGQLTDDEAETHPHRSVITRALGTEPEVDVDTMTIPIEPGDLFLICSDGLTDMMRDHEIQAVIEGADADPLGAAEQLVAAANRAGGVDNITVVLFDIAEGPPTPYEPEAVDPDATTLEAVPLARPVEQRSVRTWGASAGSRWPAMLLVVATIAVATVAVVWSVVR